MVEPTLRWRYPDPSPPEPAFLAAVAGHGGGERLARVLAGRGIPLDELDSFFGSSGSGLHDPALLPDADRAVDRLARARERGEGVLVVGDFDADGLSGLAILVRVMRDLGLDVSWHVPSRAGDGHGVSMRSVELARLGGRSLIVTVDTGSSSGAEIAAAAATGIDVLVTDHHRVPPDLPPAVAVVNPHRLDSRYPDRRLAGAGVAFRLATLLADRLGGDREAAAALADLATIGTVADVAPVLGENRAIARLGLERLRTAPRPGLAALLAGAGVAAASVTLDTVGFVIAPRLNAAGRMGDAEDAAALLLADDPAHAAELAARLEEANLARRALTRSALDEARSSLAADPPTAADPAFVRGTWPVGVIGLVAGRLAEERGRPAVVATELDGLLRASCRAGDGIDLAAALERCADIFVRHGGHRSAAGFEVAVDRWDEARDRLAGLLAGDAPGPGAVLNLDLALPAPAVDYELLGELARLEPTGPGNPAPVVGVHGLVVTRVRAASGGHTQLTLRRGLDVVDAIAFGRADLAGRLVPGDRVDVAARLASRTYGGFESLQLEILDLVSEAQARPGTGAVLPAVPAAVAS